MDFVYPFDLVGTFFFAMSGTLAGAKKQLDAFGALVIGFITAIGGGTLRDILLGKFPLFWIHNMHYVLIILLSAGISLLFRQRLQQLRKTFHLFDTLGIALFAILGTQKALVMGVPPLVAAFLGMTSAVMGGLLRDVICNEIPLILRAELYATSCLVGSGVFLGLVYYFPSMPGKALIGFSCIVVIRLLAIKYGLRFPQLRDGK
jgi:uncharacterized membrane protein YeiH